VIESFRSEADLIERAKAIAASLLAARRFPLLFGLRGDLGTGKSTWARAMLRGLGHTGRVPSPTYTLLEHYELPPVHVIHLDLYRLAAEEEIENLGIRDWLSNPSAWMLIEWPERAPRLQQRCDLLLDFAFLNETGRNVTFTGTTAAGIAAVRTFHEHNSDNEG
jgi:tRNA threonylcarbamoyladenosine biosynthesis protein TsaE